MATNAVIGALRINLGLDSAQFQDGLRNAQKGLDRFAKMAKTGLVALGTATVAAAGTFAALTKAAVDSMDSMTKLAQSIGVSVEELARLEHAANLSGVEMDSLGTALQRLSRNMFDVATGAGASAEKAFKALGISVKTASGDLKSSTDLLEEVADRFARMEDGATKTALATSLFGRAGAQLIPMLNAGSVGIRDMKDEADALGLVFSQRAGRAAEQFNDNIARIERAGSGLFIQISQELMPVLARLTDRFVAFVKEGDKVRSVAQSLRGVFNFVANEVAQLAILTARLNAEFAGVAEAFNRLKSGDFSGAWAAFKEGQDASAAMAAQVKSDIQGIFGPGAAELLGGDQDSFNEAFGQAGAAAGEAFVADLQAASSKGSQNAFQQMAQQMQEAIAQMQVDAEVVDMTTGAATRYLAVMDLTRAATEAGIPMTEALTERINLLAEAYSAATLAREGALLGRDLENSPLDQFEQEMARIDELLASGSISWKTWADAATRARMSIAGEVLGLAGQLTGALGQMFGDSKAFAIAEAVVNTAQAITKTLATYGATPWGLAAAGVAAASGAAQIATIARTNKGSRTAPRATSGGGAVGQAPEQTQQQTLNLTLRGLDRNALFSGEQVRELAQTLVDYQRDGGQLIIADA